MEKLRKTREGKRKKKPRTEKGKRRNLVNEIEEGERETK